MENAVEKLLQRYEIVQAAHIMKRSTTIPFTPIAVTMRRSHAAPQVGTLFFSCLGTDSLI